MLNPMKDELNYWDEAEPIEVCSLCEEGIYENESYYEIDGEIYCEHCIEGSRHTA